MNRTSSPWLRLARSLVVCLLVFLPLNGCAAMMGLVTGGVTGMIDLPCTLVVGERDQADDPDFYAAVVFLAPTGLVLGPVMGFFKGMALDFTWMTGRVTYAEVYGSYSHASVWRPFAWEWIESDK